MHDKFNIYFQQLSRLLYLTHVAFYLPYPAGSWVTYVPITEKSRRVEAHVFSVASRSSMNG